VPETPEELWERARHEVRVPPVDEWESWPFDGDLRVRELAAPVETERPRHGVGGVDCWRCAHPEEGVLWSDEHWTVRPLDKPSGLPVVVLLETRDHVDFTDLDDERASELGPLLLKVERAVLAVPGVGNVHVGRWGEGSEHCHIWFMARPARMEQLRSSFAAIWDDVLPPTPEEIWRANLEIVRQALEPSVRPKLGAPAPRAARLGP
jgi:diadenosine tetraphosphate (Ap4A) HIT family hydrolase